MTDLGSLLERSSDLLEPRRGSERALLAARRRRRHRHALAAGTSAAGVVLVAALGGVGVTRSDDGSIGPVAPSVTSGPGDPGDIDDSFAPVSLDDAGVQPVWDPNTALQLPAATGWALPQDLAPGAEAPVDTPRPAVAAVRRDGDVRLVDADGGQRLLPLPEQLLPAAATVGTSSPLALSPDGRWVVLAGRSRLWTRDLTGGDWQPIAYPQDLDVSAEVGIEVAAPTSRRVVLRAYATGGFTGGRPLAWSTDPATGSWSSEAWGGPQAAQGEDTTLTLSVTVRGYRVMSLVRGNDVELNDVTALGSLLHPVLSDDGSSYVAARETSSYGDRGVDHDGLVVVSTPRPTRAVAFLPVADPTRTGYYGRSGLSPLAWADDETVLVRVASPGADTAALVSWDVGTGALALVATCPADSTVVVASQSLLDP